MEPSWDGRISLEWAGEPRAFRLGVGELRALEAECRCGYLEIWRRLQAQSCTLDMVAKIIRYGLEGEGVAASEAMRLVDRYVLRPPFAANVETAQLIYAAALYIPEGASSGKPKGDGDQTTTASPSP